MMTMKTKATSRNRTRISQRTSAAARGLGGAMIAGAVAGCFSTPALAGPEGQDVVHGSADFVSDGTYTTITTSHIAIINYDAFNIGAGETVQFIQPGATSRVLNRINGAAPTQIHGNLLANGSVYFSNSAGVIFHQGAVVNVGNLHAAAGNISNANFLGNVNHFTDVTGSVINRGSISATGSVNLIGHSVQNFGTVVAEDSVTMVSGNDVLIGTRNGRVFARIEGAPTTGDAANPAGVHHHGAVVSRNGQVYFGVGDAFAMAAYSGSSIEAQDVNIAGGADAVTEITGSIDASNHDAGGVGGNVTISGDLIHLNGANIDASGHSGGGTVLVGGDIRGSGDMHKARGVFMTADSSISVDAMSQGDGGKAVLFASGSTYFGGSISARGGAVSGDGGFVEVSGLENVYLRGAVNTLAFNGKGGTLLIDPRDITIVASGAADSITGDVGFADFMGNSDAVFNDGDIQTLLATNGTLMLEAHRDIMFDNSAGNVSIDVPGEGGAFSSANLTLTAGRSITLDNGTVIDLGATGIFTATINSNAAIEAIRNETDTLAADFIMTGTASITAGGGFTLAQGASSATFIAGDVTLGAIDSVAGDIDVTGIEGDINIANALVSGGVVSIGTTGANIVFSGGASGITANTDNPGDNSAGFISLEASGASGQIIVDAGSNPTLEATGVGGRVSLAADTIVIGDNSGGVEGLSIVAGSNAAAPANGGNVDFDIRALTIQPDGDLQITTGGVANNFLGTVEFTPRSNVDLGTLTSATLVIGSDVLSNMSTENLLITGSASTAFARFGGIDQGVGGNAENITNLNISVGAAGGEIVSANDVSTFTQGSLVLEADSNINIDSDAAITSTGDGIFLYAGDALNVNAAITASNATIATADINFSGVETSVVFNVSGVTQILNDGDILISDTQSASAGTLLLTESIMSRFVSTNGATQALQIGGTASVGTQTALTTGTITVNGVAGYSTTFVGAVDRGVSLTSAAAGSDIIFSGTNEFITLSAQAADQVNFNAGTTTVTGTDAAAAAFNVSSTSGDINLDAATLIATNDEISLDAGSNAINLAAGGATISGLGTAAGVNGINFADNVQTTAAGSDLTLTSNSGINTGDITLGTGELSVTFSANDDGVARAGTIGDVVAGSIDIAATSGDDSLDISSATLSVDDEINITGLDSLTLGGANALSAGDILLEADVMTINGAVLGSQIAVRQTADGNGIVLGNGSAAANQLLLTNAELAQFFSVLDFTVGDAAGAASPQTASVTLDGVTAGALANINRDLIIGANAAGGTVSFLNNASTLGNASTAGGAVITAADTISVTSGGITIAGDSAVRFNAPTVNVAAAIDGSATGTSLVFDADGLTISSAVSATDSITFLSLTNEVIDIAGTAGGSDLDISAASLGFLTSGSLVFGDDNGDTTAVSIGSTIGSAFATQNVSLFADGGGTPSITIAPGADLGFNSLVASTNGTLAINSANVISAVSSMNLDAATINANAASILVTGVGGTLEVGRTGGTVNLQAASNSFGSTGSGGTLTFRGSVASAGNDLTLTGGRVTIGAGETINLGAGDFSVTGSTIALGDATDVAGSGANTQIVQQTLDVLTANNLNIGDALTTRVDNFGVSLDGSGAGQTITGITTYNTVGAAATDGTYFQGTFFDATAANAYTGLVVNGSTGSGGVFINSDVNASTGGVDIDSGAAGIVFGGGAITASGTSQNVNLNAGAAGNDGTLITSTAGNAITVSATGSVVFEEDANSLTAISVSGATNTFNGTLTSAGGGITISGASTFNAGGNVIDATGGPVFISGGLATFSGAGGDYAVLTTGQGVIFLNGVAFNGAANASFDTTNAGAAAAGANILFSGGIAADTGANLDLNAGTAGIINMTSGTIGSMAAQLGDITVQSAGGFAIASSTGFANSLTVNGSGAFTLGSGSTASTLNLTGDNGSGFGLQIASLGNNTINTLATLNSTNAIAMSGTTSIAGSILTTGSEITFGSGGANGDIILLSGSNAQIRTAAAGDATGGANITVNGNITTTGTPGNLTAAAGANTFTVTGGMGASGSALGDVLLTGAAQITGDVFADSFVMDAAAAGADTDFGGAVTISGDDGAGNSFVARGNDIAVGPIDASTGSGVVSLLATGAASAVSLGGDITTNNQTISLQAITTMVTSGSDIAFNAGTAGFSLLGGGAPSTFDTMGQNVTIISNTPAFDASVTVVDTAAAMGDLLTFLGATDTTNFFLGDGAGGIAGTDVLISTAALQSIQSSVDGVVFGASGAATRNITASNALLLTDITMNVGSGLFTVNGTYGVNTMADAAAVTVNGATNLDATAANAILQGNGGAITLNGALAFNNAANASSILSRGGAIAVNGDITVGAAGTSTIDSTNPGEAGSTGTITLAQAINGTANAGTLVVTSNSGAVADAAISIGGNVGDTSQLGSFTLDAGDSTVTLMGTSVLADVQSYTASTYTLMPTAAGTPVVFTSANAGAITFNGGAINVGAGSDLTVNNLNGDVTLAAVTFADAGRALNATATGNTLTLAGVGDAMNTPTAVNLTAEEMQLTANIFGTNISLTSAGDIALGSATNAAGAPNELTTAELDFLNAATAEVTVNSTGGAITTNTDAYNFANNLTLLASTAVNFNGAWTYAGTVFAEGAAININANQTSTLASMGGMANNAFILGTGFIAPFSEANAVNLNANITANGSVSLGGVATTTTVNGMVTVDTSMGNGSILICGPIQAANAMSTLTLNAGSMAMDGGLTVGSMTGFDTITLTSASNITFKGGNYTTTGNQTFTAAGFLLSSATQAVAFNAGAGAIAFNNGNISQGVNRNNSLTMTGATIAVNDVTTSFDQVYNGKLNLSGHLTTTGAVAPELLGDDGGPAAGTSITVNGNTMLMTNASVTTADDPVNSNDGVAFNGTIDGMTNTLTVTSAGNILYGGNINNVSMFTSSAVGNDIDFQLDTVNADAQSYTAATYTATGTGATPTLTFAGNGITFTGGAIQAPTADTTLIFNGGTGTTSLVAIDGVGAGSVSDLQVRGTDVNLSGAINASQVLFAHSNAGDTINIGAGAGYLLTEAELQFITDSVANPVTLIIGEAMNQVNLGGDVALSNLTNGIYRVAGGAYTGASNFSTSGAAIELTSIATTLTGGTHASMGGALTASGTTLSLTDSTLDATNMAGTGGAITITAATGIGGTSAITGNGAVALGTTDGLMPNAGDLIVTGNSIALTGNSLGTTNALNAVTLNSNTAVNLLTVNTAASQTYNTILNLLDTAVLTNTAGALAFNQAVNLAGTVAVNNAGTVTFADALGGTAPSTLAINVTGTDAVSFQQVGTAASRFTDVVVTNGTTTFNQDVFLSGLLDVDNATNGTVADYIFDVATLVWDGTVDFGSSQNVSFTLGSANFGSGGSVNFGDGNLTVTDASNAAAGVTFASATTVGAGDVAIASDSNVSFLGDVIATGNDQTTVNVGTGASGGTIAFGGEVGSTASRIRSLVVNTTGELQFTNAAAQSINLVNGFAIDGVTGSATAVRTFGQTTIDTSLASAAGSIVLATNLLGSGGANDGFTFIVDRTAGALLPTGAFGGTIDREVPVIRINGNVGSANAADALTDLRFNTNGGDINGRGFVPANATIVFGDPNSFGSAANMNGTSHTVNLDGDFVMGQNEKLVVLGNIDVNATNATVGDMIATGTLDFGGITGNTRFLTRDPGLLLPADAQTPVTDLGIDIIADQLIFNLSGPASSFVVGSGNSPIFADSDAFVEGAEGFGLTIAQFSGNLREEVLIPDSSRVVVDTLFSGTSRENVSEAIAGAVPREAQSGDVGNDTSAGTARREELIQIGIFPKRTVQEYLDAGQPGEAAALMGDILDALRGRSLYDDSLDVANAANVDGVTNMSRLQFDIVIDVLDAYKSLVISESVDPATGETQITYLNNDIETALFNALDDYYATIPADEDFTVESFRAFLDNSADHLDASGYLIQIDELVQQIQILGLTNFELINVYNNVLNPILPSDFRTELNQFLGLEAN
jgi:filamentous hemagglutinin family protein